MSFPLSFDDCILSGSSSSPPQDKKALDVSCSTDESSSSPPQDKKAASKVVKKRKAKKVEHVSEKQGRHDYLMKLKYARAMYEETSDYFIPDITKKEQIFYDTLAVEDEFFGSAENSPASAASDCQEITDADFDF
jgi:hypothetical protein